MKKRKDKPCLPDSAGDGAADHEQLPFPDSGWLPGLQRTIKRKLDAGELDEVDADVFHGMLGKIAEEKEDEKE